LPRDAEEDYPWRVDNVSQHRPHRPDTRAGVDFIKAAWCPLRFKAKPLREHSEFASLGPVDPAIGNLHVGDPLNYARVYYYWDRRSRRQRQGTQVIAAPFGFAPEDFDLLLAIYNFLKEGQELKALPQDHIHHWTADFLGRLAGLPVTNTKDYSRIRSRVFRLSCTQVVNSAFWNPEAETYDIKKFGLFNIEAMSRVTESRRPIEIRIDPAFLDLLSFCRSFQVDFGFYRSLRRAERRFYLLANREGWNRRDSPVYLADEFAKHQLGYSDAPEQKYVNRQCLKELLKNMENRGLIRPPAGAKAYFRKRTDGIYGDQITLQWSRGPLLFSRRNKAVQKEDHARDPLYCQIRHFRDEQGKAVPQSLYRHWLAKFGRKRLERHAPIVAAQIEQRPETVLRSEIATFVDRLNKDYREPPDWYQKQLSKDQLPKFEKVQPSQTSMELYGVCFS
jgi:hypothetical protein